MGLFDDGIKNARIGSTFLGREDHGILTFNLELNYCSSSFQGFGSYALDEYDQDKKERVATAYGLECIIEILRVVGVDSWEKLSGKHVRAEVKDGLVYAISHILEDDKRFSPKELFDTKYANKDRKA